MIASIDWYANPDDPPLIGSFNLDDTEVFFVWLSYMQPATLAGAFDKKLVYDRAIYCGPYFIP